MLANPKETRQEIRQRRKLECLAHEVYVNAIQPAEETRAKALYDAYKVYLETKNSTDTETAYKTYLKVKYNADEKYIKATRSTLKTYTQTILTLRKAKKKGKKTP